MAREYLKKAVKTASTDAGDVRATVQKILGDIEAGGDAAAREYADKFDKYQGNLILTADEVAEATAKVPQRLRDDIRFAHDNVRRFAEVQKSTLKEVELEIVPGLIAGQKSIPVRAAGCYVPGGRYSHIASAIMTVTTAKVAGCSDIIVACSPPRPDTGIAPAIVYAADLCGADQILAMGGVQGVCRNDLRFVRPAESRHSGRPWQPVRGRGQAHPVRSRRHRHDRRTHGQFDPG